MTFSSASAAARPSTTLNPSAVAKMARSLPSLSPSPPSSSRTGRITGASKIARDITEKRQLERQLRQSQKMEAIGQLTGGIAHDFNNLLGVIFGNLDLLERQIADNPTALKRLLTARKAATRGADLTRRMLAFSSREELRPRSTSLDEAIANVLELSARALGPEIRLTAHPNPLLPPVYVDVGGLEAALLNLIVNARDAMPRGGSLTIGTRFSQIEVTYPLVRTGELEVGPYACISVSDSGHGMSQETVDRAFEPFFTTKPRHRGTGLGLAMVYGFTKQSGGAVKIYSEVGFGTTISLYLPLADHAVEPPQPDTLEAPEPTTPGTVLVLVVDDEEEILEIAVEYLEDMGYGALRAEDGLAALAILARHKVDLIISDIIMPGGMNGVEFVDAARKLYPGTRAMYCSGFPADALAERSSPINDAPLLHKPYQRSEFESMIRSVMATPPDKPA